MTSDDFKFPIRYEDPEYQDSHRKLFSGALLSPLENVLPPNVSQLEFDRAMSEFEKVVGKEHTHQGKALEEYVDPYELWEKEGKRKTPCGAVW
jgi:hypothetical protein